MKKYIRRIFGLIAVGAIIMYMAAPVGAQGGHQPITDAYTDRNVDDVPFGSEQYMLLSASYASPDTGCVETSYLWFKFTVPSTSTTISYAELAVPMDAAYSGNESLDMELHSSADTGWESATITWANQPQLDSTTLATAFSTLPGSDALFISASLAAYLEAHKGQTVTLVVIPDCDGSIAIQASRLVRAMEHPMGSAVELVLRGPTAITLDSYSVRIDKGSFSPLYWIAVISFLCLAGAIQMISFFRHRKS